MKKMLFWMLTFTLFVSCKQSGDGFAPGSFEIATPPQNPPPPATFNPSQITQMHTWFDASDSSLMSLSGSQVITWKDKNNTAVQFEQTTPAARPLLQNNIINGKSAVQFDGVNDFMQATINTGITSEITLTYVIQLASYEARIPFSFNTTLYSYGPDVYFYNGQLHWNTGDSGANPFATSSYPSANVPHIITVKNSQILNRADLYIDGAFIGSAGFRNTAITNYASPRLFIGNWVSGSYFINGYFAELIIYNKIIDETERAALEGYLKTKWGIN